MIPGAGCGNGARYYGTRLLAKFGPWLTTSAGLFVGLNLDSCCVRGCLWLENKKESSSSDSLGQCVRGIYQYTECG